jgi:muramoyltetrapeptide carboxypeptidase
MNTPAYLVKGDTVALLSTARKISKAEIQFAVELIESWGFKVLLAPNIFAEHDQFCGTDEQRAADLQFMMDHPTVKAILCARGGYGTVRILDRIDYSKFKDNPKWIVGYSDVTALHARLNHGLGIESLHASMPINFSTNTDEALESLRKALCGELKSYEFNSSSAGSLQVDGILGGGNLSILYSLSGSEDQWRPDGDILFLEDLDEYLYHIDRMMMNLKRSGLLNGLKAILIGGMSDMNDNAIPFGKSAVDIIEETANEIRVPLIKDFPAGHIEDNRALYFGRKVRIELIEGKAKLLF